MRTRMIAAAWLGLLAGCAGSDPPQVGSPAAAPPPVAADPVTVELVDHAELLKRLAARRGRVVVLDCWSTSCPPCIKEFPGLVSLARDYGEQVACLSLSFDYEGFGRPEEVLPPVQQFLSQVGATEIENLLGREDSDTLYEKLGLTSVPAVYVYAADGTLLRCFDDDFAMTELGRPFTYADVRQQVDQALASQPGAPASEKEAS